MMVQEYGIPDSSETGAFRSMEKYTRYPGQKDWNREQELKWWYGNDAPGYDPNPEELTNIKDRLHELLPNTELAVSSRMGNVHEKH